MCTAESLYKKIHIVRINISSVNAYSATGYGRHELNIAVFTL